jgi:glycosyltransferase involved in cell wall biosynthesis
MGAHPHGTPFYLRGVMTMLASVTPNKRMTPTLAMVGPIELSQYMDVLDSSRLPEKIPKGLGGSPVNLLTRELLSRGWNLLIVTVSPDVSEEVILEGENLKICVGPDRPKHARDFFAGERSYMLSVLRREQPDIVHAQWTYEFAMAAQASGLPHVITAHDAPINILRLNFIPYRIARTLMAYRVLSRAKRVVSVSSYVAQHLSRFMLYRGTKEVIPNGMPDKLFTHHNVEHRVDHPLTFATILSGWAGRKNGQVAISAFAVLRRTHPDAKLIMFGYGHGPGEEGQLWASEHGIETGIEFVGQIPYAKVMDRLAAEVDVLVHPALEESFGMTLIEAMALSLPVIGGNNSGAVPWVLDYGKAGMLVDVKDSAEMTEAMLYLANNVEARKELGQRGRIFAETHFHIRVVAEAYEKIYSELLGERT